jgi:hypothetical protein
MGKRGRPKKHKLLDEAYILSLHYGQSTFFAVSRVALRKINSPSAIQFWWCESQNLLLISATDENDDFTTIINDKFYSHSRGGAKIYNTPLLNKIANLFGWFGETHARFYGEYVPEINMVAFRLNSVSVQG